MAHSILLLHRTGRVGSVVDVVVAITLDDVLVETEMEESNVVEEIDEDTS
jgi:hypothetical protein